MKNHLVMCVLGVFFFCCSKESGSSSNANSNNDIISDDLHVSWKTPDWHYDLQCNDLDFIPDANPIGNRYFVRATSLSTNEKFAFFYPKDSSEIVKSTTLGKYPIKSYTSFIEPDGSGEFFQFLQGIPITEGNSERIYSKEGFDLDQFNEVVSIKYLQSLDNFAVFLVKCRYSMKMAKADGSSEKLVTGDFTFKIHADRN